MLDFRVSISVTTGIDCGVTDGNLLTSLLMYGSYFVLFANFFLQRYLNTPPKRVKQINEECSHLNNNNNNNIDKDKMK